MTASPLVIAKDALALLQRGTTQPSDVHLYARDAAGNPVGPFSPKAAKWTLSGALLTAARCENLIPSAVARDVSDAIKAVVGAPPGEWANQPGRRAEEVWAALETVIRNMEAKP